MTRPKKIFDDDLLCTIFLIKLLSKQRNVLTKEACLSGNLKDFPASLVANLVSRNMDPQVGHMSLSCLGRRTR